jgi:hypothetical protein
VLQIRDLGFLTSGSRIGFSLICGYNKKLGQQIFFLSSFVAVVGTVVRDGLTSGSRIYG